MQHPFEGVMGVEQETTEARATRRSVLGRMLGAVAALFGVGAVASAAPPRRRPTTHALGEEGGFTTQALGEEGGRPPGNWFTTFALGEEGRVGTTTALRREGGRTRRAGQPNGLAC